MYPGCALAAPERVGEDCGRDWLDPAMLLEEDKEEEQAAGSPGILLEERANGPGKLSSVRAPANNIQNKAAGSPGASAVTDTETYLARLGLNCQTQAHCGIFLLCSSAFSWNPSHRRLRPRCLPVRRNTHKGNAADLK